MVHDPERPTVDDRPTIPGWAVEAIQEVQRQLDRLFSGYACRPCRGAGELLVLGRLGFYVVACGSCDGRGIDRE